MKPSKRLRLSGAYILLAAHPLFAVAAEAQSRISDEILQLRDPFLAPKALLSTSKPRNELETFALSELKLLGLMTGPKAVKAMVQAPNGKTYFVSENTRIGNRSGIVKAILPNEVKVTEKFVNIFGEEELVSSVIPLASEGESGPNSAASGGSSGTTSRSAGMPSFSSPPGGRDMPTGRQDDGFESLVNQMREDEMREMDTQEAAPMPLPNAGRSFQERTGVSSEALKGNSGEPGGPVGGTPTSAGP